MTDELPEVFCRVTPRPAPPELCAKVLAAVARELTNPIHRQRPRWERAFELTVAANLLLALGLNAWRWQAERELYARLYGTRRVPTGVAEVSKAAESVTDANTARRLREQMVAARPATVSMTSMARQYQRLIDELSGQTKGRHL